MSTENKSLLYAMQICDSLFPIGSYTLSNGLETYVQKNIITTPEHLEEYLTSYISILPYNELGVCALSYNASAEEVKYLDSLYNASKSPFEVRTGSQRIAKRFLKASDNLFTECHKTKAYKTLVENGECKGHQCVAYGLYFSDCNLPLIQGLCAYAYSLCSAIVTNCVKLVPLSQLAGQKILASAIEKITLSAEKALAITHEQIGVNGYGFDVRAMEHEKLYSRQYMS